jgi:predicted deacylase
MRRSTAICTAVLATLAAADPPTTGDIYQGYPVLSLSASSPLDLSTLPANTISRYWLNPGVSQGNIPYFLPVMIARGTNDSLSSGTVLSLSASIHGDELNGIPPIHRVFSQLNSSGIVTDGGLNGTIIGVPQLNPNGNYLNGRNFYTPGNSGFLTNLNRIMPGSDDPETASLTNSYAGAIWYGLWANATTVDVAIDLHTLSTGSDGPLWAYADFAAPGVQRLAELAMPDVIKIDPGEPGSVETTWVEYGVPAITLEVGPAKRWNSDLIDRAEQFVYRVLEDYAMVSSSGLAGNGSAEAGERVEVDLSETYKGTNVSSVAVTQTGWVNMTVSVLEDVEEGQEVGVLYGWFGDVLETLTSEVSGRVLQVQTDPAVELGSSVLTVVYNATDDGEESNSRRVKRGISNGLAGRVRMW